MRDRLLVLTGLLTGFRAGELVTLRVQDVWDGGRIADFLTVQRKRLKGGRRLRTGVRSRTVPLHAQLRAALATYLAQRYPTGEPAPRDYLFPSQKGENRPILCETARKLVKGAARSAHLSGPVSTHSLRKTFAREVYEGTGHDLHKLQRALGHSSILTTVQYLDTSERSVREAILGIAAPGLPTPAGGPDEAEAAALMPAS